MSPRTNWDTRETPGAAAYRRRRRERLGGMGDESKQRGRTLPGDRPGLVREGQHYSPEEQAQQQDYQFERGENLKREHEFNVEKLGGFRQSGEASFRTGKDAALAMTDAERKKRRK